MVTFKRLFCLFSALAVVSVSSCTSDEGGTPVPTGESTPTSSSGADSEPSSPAGTSVALAGIDPCSLLSDAEIAAYGNFGEPAPQNHGDDRSCNWQTQQGSGDSIGISVDIRNSQGVSDANDAGLGIDTTEVGGRQVARIPTQTGGCIIAIGVTESSRVDVRSNAFDNQKSCDIADDLAGIVEPKLPEAS